MTTMRLTFLVLPIAITLSYVSVVAQQNTCDINFAPETVKPTQLESFKKLLSSFSPKGETERLSDLRTVIQNLQKEKSDLADTLTIVSTANSLADWQKAKVAQIPEIQNKVVTLFRKVSDESREGGLFAGSRVVAQLKIMINAKAKQLSLLCSTSYRPLPLTGKDKEELDKLIDDVRAEMKTLGDIDAAIGDLISKAQEQDKAKKS